MSIEEMIQRGRGLKVAAYVKAIRAMVRETIANPTPEEEFTAVERMTLRDWHRARVASGQHVASEKTVEQIVNVFRVAVSERAA